MKKLTIIKLLFISALVLVLARFIMGCVLWEHEPTQHPLVWFVYPFIKLMRVTCNIIKNKNKKYYFDK